MGNYQHSGTLDVGFSLSKQVDFSTPLSTATINKKLPFRDFGMASKQRSFQSDRAFFGKGHPFGTYNRQQGSHFTFNRTFDATSLSLAFGLAFCMQKVVTWTPTGATSARRHLIKFYNPVPGNEGISTSIIEKAGDSQKLLSGVAVGQVSLNAASKYDMQLALQCLARKAAADTTALPALTPSSFLQMSSVKLGTFAAPDDISNRVESFHVQLNQNPNFRFMPGSLAGEEQLPNVYLIGAQTVSLDLTAAFANALRDYMLNNTNLRAVLYAKGDLIEGALFHDLTIEFPKLIMQGEQMSDQNSSINYQMKFSDDTVLYDDSVIASGAASVAGTTTSISKTGETFITKGVAVGDEITMNTGAAGANETRTITEVTSEIQVSFTPAATSAPVIGTTYSVQKNSAVKFVITNTEVALPTQ